LSDNLYCGTSGSKEYHKMHQIKVITVYYFDGKNNSMLPPARNYSVKNLERSMPVLLRINFTKITYHRVLQKQRYIVRKRKTKETMLLPEGSLAIMRHCGGFALMRKPDCIKLQI